MNSPTPKVEIIMKRDPLVFANNPSFGALISNMLSISILAANVINIKPCSWISCGHPHRKGYNQYLTD
jgi:hypothetical protein